MRGAGTKIKICGLSRMEDIQCVNQWKPDYIGFVFAKSRRQVTEDQAEKLKRALDPGIQAVGVFVNEDPEVIGRLCRRGVIDLIQLHGDEDEEYMSHLADCTDVPVIRAVRVRSREQILQAQETDCQYLLLDTYHPGEYGGGGETFDPALIPPLQKPWFLAGGLDGENVLEKIRGFHPYGVDVSSGTESQGRKDPVKIQEFIEKIRRLTLI